MHRGIANICLLAGFVVIVLGTGCADKTAIRKDSPKQKNPAMQRSQYPTVKGTVIENKLVVYDDSVKRLFGSTGTGWYKDRGKGYHEVLLRTEDGRKLTFWRHGQLSELTKKKQEISEGDVVSVKYFPYDNDSGFMYVKITLMP